MADHDAGDGMTPPYRLQHLNRIGVRAGKIAMVIPLAGEISASEAMEIAAWLITLAEGIDGAPDIKEVLMAVAAT